MTRPTGQRSWPNGRRPSATYRRTTTALSVAASALTCISIALAPCAGADSNASIRSAVSAAHASCPPLRPVPVIDEAAKLINGTTDKWINFASRSVPDNDALPVLQDLGYPAHKAYILSGAAKDLGTSIKAAILSGFAVLPDCSYTSVGVDSTYNARKALVLVTVVLAG